jgi:hypothetical protein
MSFSLKPDLLKQLWFPRGLTASEESLRVYTVALWVTVPTCGPQSARGGRTLLSDKKPGQGTRQAPPPAPPHHLVPFLPHPGNL